MIAKLSKQQLSQLRGESQALEFKKSLGSQGEGFKSLAAMINTDAAKGTIFFGVDPNGAPTGVEPGDLDSAQRKLAEHARLKFDPPIIYEIRAFDCEGRILIAVSASRAPTVPLHEYDGRALIREGTSNRRLSFEERQALIRRRSRDSHPGPWRCDTCGAIAGIVSGVEMTDQGSRKTYEHPGCGGEWWPTG